MPLSTEVHAQAPDGLGRIPVIVDRFILEKKRWRTRAENGVDIGVDLERPCRNGDVIHVDETGAYFVEQVPEEVIRIAIPVESESAAKLGWFLGNQHLQIEVADGWVLLAHDKQLLKKLQEAHLHPEVVVAVFSPDPHSKTHHSH